MLHIKENFQILSPVYPRPNSVNQLPSINPLTFQKKTRRLVYWMQDASNNNTYSFNAGDMVLKGYNGSFYNVNNHIVGGWFKLNTVIKDFLSIYNFSRQHYIIFNKTLLTPKAEKFIANIYQGIGGANFLSNDLFNMLINQDIKPIVQALPQETINNIVMEWVNELSLSPGTWEYNAEEGIKFLKSTEDVLQEIKSIDIIVPPIIEDEALVSEQDSETLNAVF